MLVWVLGSKRSRATSEEFLAGWSRKLGREQKIDGDGNGRASEGQDGDACWPRLMHTIKITLMRRSFTLHHFSQASR